MIVGRLSPEAKGVRGPAFASGQTYLRAIERAGGMPIIVPPIPTLADRIDELIDRVDALVLHGGGDIDPARYGQEASAEQLYGIVPEHDDVELAVVRAALAADLPMLAICRGLQVLNVAQGGTLVQHLGSEDHWLKKHPVHLTAGSRLASAFASTHAEACHSVHHQAIDTLGSGLTVTATADDGVTEAVEVDGSRWAVAVQWHPEDTAAKDPAQQGLFDTLVAQARR